MRTGETATIAKAGAIRQTAKIPDYYDLRVTIGETPTFTVHDPKGTTALQFAPGQVMLFRLNGLPSPKHCGILVAPDRFIHAQERLGVIEGNLTEGWRRRIAGRFDFPPNETL